MVQFLKSSWQEVVNACTPSTYPSRLEKIKFEHGFWYLYKIFVFLAFLNIVFFIATFAQGYPKLKEGYVGFTKNIASAYPPGLELKIENGKLQTNVPQPFYIKWTDNTKWLSEGEKRPPAHLLTIDTNAQVEDYEGYDSLILVTDSHLVARDNQGLRTVELKEFDNFTLNQQIYSKFIQELQPVFAWLPFAAMGILAVLLICIPFIGSFFAVLGQLIFLLVTTLVVWGIAKVMKREGTYSSLYRLGLYAVTPIIILDTITPLFGFSMPFLGSIVAYAIFMTFVIDLLPKQTQAAAKN